MTSEEPVDVPWLNGLDPLPPLVNEEFIEDFNFAYPAVSGKLALLSSLFPPIDDGMLPMPKFLGKEPNLSAEAVSVQ